MSGTGVERLESVPAFAGPPRPAIWLNEENTSRMTSPGAPPPPPTPGQDASETARRHLLASLDEQLSRHDEDHVDTGRELAGLISELRWSSEARRLSCHLGDNGSAYRVELDLPFAVGDPQRIAYGEGQVELDPVGGAVVAEVAA